MLFFFLMSRDQKRAPDLSELFGLKALGSNQNIFWVPTQISFPILLEVIERFSVRWEFCVSGDCLW